MLASTGLFTYGLLDAVGDVSSRAGDRAGLELASAGRGAANLAYLVLTHGPSGVPQTPPDFPGDSNGPTGTAGAVVTATLPLPLCVPPVCIMVPPVVAGSAGNAPSNVLFSTGDGGNSSNSNVTTRPTPKGSENDVGNDLGPGNTPQASYKGGKQVPYGTPGSVRPDFVADNGTASFEVKNYNIQTNASGLINNVSQQAFQRAVNLPDGMVQQVVIDVRGQILTPQQELVIRQGIVQKSNGIISPNAIQFKR
jgi:filamentous hemagglutinin